MALRLRLLALLLCIQAAQCKKHLLKGISYGPSPKMSLGQLPNDDFMCEAARPQWDADGRGDLALMKKMGANAARLYGNDPRENHKAFLDEARRVGIGAIPGLSDWPYLQAPDSCQTTGYDCYEQVKAAYLQTLLGGFAANGTYHPAVRYMIAVNEPDMKLPNIAAPMSFTKALISALDGMLDAEKEANITSGRMPNFTVAFSFSICSLCGEFSKKPALGQMWQLRDAMSDPSKYDYTPRNDLSEFYRTRFVNSFNTANPYFELPKLFLKDYEEAFPGTPTFIAEYHSPNQDTATDLAGVLKLAKASPVLLGVSFFEWENRRDEQGHSSFGLFELGTAVGESDARVSTMSFFGSDYEVPCLIPAMGAFGEVIAKGVAKAFGGVFEAAGNCEAIEEDTTTTTTTAEAEPSEAETTAQIEPLPADPSEGEEEPSEGDSESENLPGDLLAASAAASTTEHRRLRGGVGSDRTANKATGAGHWV